MQVTTTNQETGAVGKEPLMALGKYRCATYYNNFFRIGCTLILLNYLMRLGHRQQHNLILGRRQWCWAFWCV